MSRRVTRRAVLAAALPLVSGCAAVPGGGVTGSAGGPVRAACGFLPGEPIPDGNPAFGAVAQQGDLSLFSTAITESGKLPNRYGHYFDDVNPPLDLSGVPDDARSLALVLDGPDVPGGEFTYWLVWNIPPDVGRIPAGWTVPDPAVEGGNSIGNSDAGYVGPDPPDKQLFRFKLFALDGLVDLPRGASKEALGNAMSGRIVARTQLEFWYDFHTSAHTGMANDEGHSSVLGSVCERLV